MNEQKQAHDDSDSEYSYVSYSDSEESVVEASESTASYSDDEEIITEGFGDFVGDSSSSGSGEDYKEEKDNKGENAKEEKVNITETFVTPDGTESSEFDDPPPPPPDDSDTAKENVELKKVIDTSSPNPNPNPLEYSSPNHRTLFMLKSLGSRSKLKMSKSIAQPNSNAINRAAAACSPRSSPLHRNKKSFTRASSLKSFERVSLPQLSKENEIESDIYHCVIRESGALGIRLSPVDEEGVGTFVEEVNPNGLARKSCSQIAAYDRLQKVGEVDVTTLTFDEAINTIRSQTRPMHLCFKVSTEPPPKFQMYDSSDY